MPALAPHHAPVGSVAPGRADALGLAVRRAPRAARLGARGRRAGSRRGRHRARRRASRHRARAGRHPAHRGAGRRQGGCRRSRPRAARRRAVVARGLRRPTAARRLPRGRRRGPPPRPHRLPHGGARGPDRPSDVACQRDPVLRPRRRVDAARTRRHTVRAQASSPRSSGSPRPAPRCCACRAPRCTSRPRSGTRCDRLGILVWQDAMLATLDPSDDDDVQHELAAELAEVLRPLQGRPSLAIVSGGSETEQQPTMMGLPPERRVVRALVETFPAVVARVAPGTPYVTSSPSGRRPPDPLLARGRALVRGRWLPAAAARHPPCRRTPRRRVPRVRRPAGARDRCACGAGLTPTSRSDRWEAGIPRDNGSSWDFEDVPRPLRARALRRRSRGGAQRRSRALPRPRTRAALAHLGIEVFAEWRRPGSGSSGGLVLQARDLAPGAGWGLLDTDGRAKSMLLALRRAWSPVALLATDEGLDGLWLHALNDTPRPLDTTVEVTLVDRAGRAAPRQRRRSVHLGPRSGRTLSLDGVLGAFRDVAARLPVRRAAVRRGARTPAGRRRRRVRSRPPRRRPGARDLWPMSGSTPWPSRPRTAGGSTSRHAISRSGWQSTSTLTSRTSRGSTSPPAPAGRCGSRATAPSSRPEACAHSTASPSLLCGRRGRRHDGDPGWFLGPADVPLFAWWHVPEGGARSVAVLVGPVGDEQLVDPSRAARPRRAAGGEGASPSLRVDLPGIGRQRRARPRGRRRFLDRRSGRGRRARPRIRC